MPAITGRAWPGSESAASAQAGRAATAAELPVRLRSAGRWRSNPARLAGSGSADRSLNACVEDRGMQTHQEAGVWIDCCRGFHAGAVKRGMDFLLHLAKIARAPGLGHQRGICSSQCRQPPSCKPAARSVSSRCSGAGNLGCPSVRQCGPPVPCGPSGER